MATHDIKLNVNGGVHAVFVVEKKDKWLAELDAEIVNSEIIVHSVITTKKHRRKLKSKLFTALVTYAREHYLKVVTLNRFISKRLNEDPYRYADIWEQDN